MKNVTHTLAANFTAVQPGQVFKGKAGEVVEWPAAVVAAAKAAEPQASAKPAPRRRKRNG